MWPNSLVTYAYAHQDLLTGCIHLTCTRGRDVEAGTNGAYPLRPNHYGIPLTPRQPGCSVGMWHGIVYYVCNSMYCTVYVRTGSMYCTVYVRTGSMYCTVYVRTGSMYCTVYVRTGSMYCTVYVRTGSMYCTVYVRTGSTYVLYCIRAYW